ncbi:MAG: hypothetical protein KKB20_07040 [Proteobacteria bacterium]|nr:hypothetical protein [Pseudomonadota bacterium]
MSKIAVLTNFASWNPGYSLSGIVRDQVLMLERHGHEVVLFVQEDFSGDADGLTPRAVIPALKLIDYKSVADLTPEHKMAARRIAEVLKTELAGFDYVLAHDWIFLGHNLPHALAVRIASPELPDVRWLHWIHSIPSGRRDWWLIKDYGPNHKIVFPNRADALRVAEQFRGGLEDVRVIPHIKDLRTWFDFHEDTRAFIDEYPAVMQADIVQVLPASQDRLEYKRVPEVIKIFGAFKRLGLSVCLVVANQWATRTTYLQDMNQYKDMARAAGIEPGREFVFTSDFDYPRFEIGVPRRMVRELMQCANLFCFPTHHESFGLVVPEAALAGCFLVLNGSLPMQREISGSLANYHDFGSYCHQVHREGDDDAWLDQVAMIIFGRMRRNESILTRTFCRQTYNYDAVYFEHYRPVLAESATWGALPADRSLAPTLSQGERPEKGNDKIPLSLRERTGLPASGGVRG